MGPVIPVAELRGVETEALFRGRAGPMQPRGREHPHTRTLDEGPASEGPPISTGRPYDAEGLQNTQRVARQARDVGGAVRNSAQRTLQQAGHALHRRDPPASNLVRHQLPIL